MDQTTPEDVGTEDARAFVEEAYRTRSEDEDLEHPFAVARLLQNDGQPPVLVIAGLLHDVLEDADVSAEEVRDRFGPEVTRIVEALTQDPSIPDYAQRKAALRRQILDAGRDAATVALADKAAKMGSLHSRPTDKKFDHYRATIEGVEERYGRSRLSELARSELERLPPS